MKSRLLIGSAVVIGLFSASCYPVDEKPGKKPVEKKQPTAEELKKKEEEEARKKAEEELKKKQEETTGNVNTDVAVNNPPANTGTGGTGTTETTRRDYPFANKVPGKDGYVFSPYNNKVVDVNGIPSGTLVQDPTYPPAEKKYFRVP